MKDKFRENFKIALPAAPASLVIILVLSFNANITGAVIMNTNLSSSFRVLDILAGGIIGINVLIVLLLGILSGAIIMKLPREPPPQPPICFTSMGVPAPQACSKQRWLPFWSLPFARSFANMAASHGCSTPSRTRSRTAKAASSAWASWLMHAGYRNREQHRGDCYGQPHRGGHGENS